MLNNSDKDKASVFILTYSLQNTPINATSWARLRIYILYTGLPYDVAHRKRLY